MSRKMDLTTVEVPERFQFPFPPYDIQEDFMKDLYRVVTKGGIGIFESPTGTGKSLSLICGVLTWLTDFEEQQEKEIMVPPVVLPLKNQSKDDNSNDSDLPDWVLQFGERKKKDEKQQQLRDSCERLKKQKAELEQLRKEPGKGLIVKGKRKFSDHQKDEINEKEIGNEIDEILGKDPDSDIILTEYRSDDDSSSDEGDDEFHCTKVYYCSRTHSQLAQFTREVKKSPFKDTRMVTLGSRQSLCINEDVRKLKSNNKISDRCLELRNNKRKGKVGSESKRKKRIIGCPYDQQQDQYKDHVLVEIKDIEDLVVLGKQLHSCPYYGTRHAIPAAQLVCLPYNLLLNKASRQASGIKLDGNVVIIDEAHNLLETINNIHSVEITGAQISACISQLSKYLDRYRTRLKPSNVMYIKQLLFVLKSLLSYLGGENTSYQPIINKTDAKLQKINDFIFVTQIDNVNMFKLCRFCQSTMISKKLNGFVDRYKEHDLSSEDAITNGEVPSFTSPMYLIESFLEALTNADVDGRVVVSKQGNSHKSRMKYLQLNPAIHFRSVVEESRAVIMAGGTMQPTSEFKDQLFACIGINPEQIHEFSCGHVIPNEQLLPLSFDRGPSGLQFDFSFQSRDTPQIINECGRLLLNICTVIPGGIVCFFPSFDYMNKAFSHWKKCGIWEKLNSKKKVFQEPRLSSQLENILNSYSNCVKKSNGGMLLSVVGGKMSEGINFSDDLGRCVVMVGLPYPNITSPELQEKMNYLSTTVGANAGQEYYDNLCMKAVNQSIGRAIRHRADYASMLLLDYRYSTSKVRRKLPSWIGSRMEHHVRFATAFGAIRKFFADKR